MAPLRATIRHYLPRPHRTGPPILRALLVAACLLLGTVLAACNSSAPPTSGAVVVTIHHMAFHPHTVTIHTGQTVAWHFDDPGVVHNVTSVGSSLLHSPNKEYGWWEHTFTHAGTFRYRCTIHRYMTGEVKVLG